MEPESPITFVYDDDAVLWAVATEHDTTDWLVIRVDGDRPQLEALEAYICTAAHWHLAGHQGWALAGSLQEQATWQLYLPGHERPWTIQLDGATRAVHLPARLGVDGDEHDETEFVAMPGDVVEALSWRLAGELARRHPADLWIAHTVPIEGTTYDCLTLMRPGNRGQVGPPIFQLNRGGSIHIHHNFEGEAFGGDWPRWSWHEYLYADPYRFLQQLESRAGLPPVDGVPTTTPRTLAWRLIATLVASGLRSMHRIRAVPGFTDTTWKAEPNMELFAAFPNARRAAENQLSDDPMGTPHRRFWFVCVDDAPRVVLSTEGRAWALGNIEYDLMHDYDAADRRLGPVAAQLLQDIID